ncbi:hypothetical protein ACFLYO_05005, partial [Chloroflexota bacterium]
MARKRKKPGICSICGKQDLLSFEHVPPKAAFNKETFVEYTVEERITKKSIKGRRRQGGMGKHTLCEVCNNNTGSWYGNEYVKWAKIGDDLIRKQTKTKAEGYEVTLYNVYPLRFLKQIVTCFFSEQGEYTPAFSQNNPDLVKFVLEKENTQLSSGFRFFMNLYPRLQRTALRRYPIAGRIPIRWNTNTGEIVAQGAYIFSEITHPPFQLLMT